MMGTLLMEHARRAGVKRFVSVGTICSYPKLTPVPFREDGSLERLPRGDQRAVRPREEDAAGPVAGLPPGVRLRRVERAAGQSLRPAATTSIPETSHVIPALIRKCVEAVEARRGARSTVWGTGNATREFLYVEDAAGASSRAIERLDGQRAGEHRRRLRDLDPRSRGRRSPRSRDSRGGWPGTPPSPTDSRAAASTRRAPQSFWAGRATTTFDEGLRRTIEWFRTESGALAGADSSRR